MRATLQLFRLVTGDLGIPDAALDADDRPAVEAKAIARLDRLFNDPHRPPLQKPLRARLLAENGTAIAEFERRIDGTRRVSGP